MSLVDDKGMRPEEPVGILSLRTLDNVLLGIQTILMDNTNKLVSLPPAVIATLQHTRWLVEGFKHEWKSEAEEQLEAQKEEQIEPDSEKRSGVVTVLRRLNGLIESVTDMMTDTSPVTAKAETKQPDLTPVFMSFNTLEERIARLEHHIGEGSKNWAWMSAAVKKMDTEVPVEEWERQSQRSIDLALRVTTLEQQMKDCLKALQNG